MNNTFALITGASFGIGKEIAKVMAAHKHNLILTARSEAPLHALAKELEEQYHISTHIIVCDLSVPDAAYQLCKEIENLHCSIDILVNNAGFGVYGEFVDSDLSKQQDLMQLNCIALMQLCKLLSYQLKANKGKILNIASVAAFYSGPLMAVYYASKAFVLSFSEALAFELAPLGITVTAHCPGPTKSNFQQSAGMHKSRLFSTMPVPESYPVALHAYKAMMKGKTIAIHGLSNRIMLILSSFVPRFLKVKAVHAFQSSKA